MHNYIWQANLGCGGGMDSESGNKCKSFPVFHCDTENGGVNLYRSGKVEAEISRLPKDKQLHKFFRSCLITQTCTPPAWVLHLVVQKPTNIESMLQRSPGVPLFCLRLEVREEWWEK